MTSLPTVYPESKEWIVTCYACMVELKWEDAVTGEHNYCMACAQHRYGFDLSEGLTD